LTHHATVRTLPVDHALDDFRNSDRCRHCRGQMARGHAMTPPTYLRSEPEAAAAGPST
jgi:hypothetical protein